jgi:hypothetical protein
MTRAEAIAIRQAQLNGVPVTALELQEAIETLERKNRAGRPYKYRLPELPRPVREMANATLCFNLGRAIKAAP